ncbi:unnamed protein product [Periconia digitata]|uniref:Heterokaryon incompatibility domain-containing protein n=1 Tax=Periconia digitata TaxID=1303443 RepID=A0A9W4U1G2_9PLEO|nr:unnamed protein product [Periconia digitata]
MQSSIENNGINADPCDAPLLASPAHDSVPESMLENQSHADLDGKDSPSGPACSFIPSPTNTFQDFMAESRSDCRHCNSRKEAILHFAPEVALKPNTYSIDWWGHDITSCYNTNIQRNVNMISDPGYALEFFAPFPSDGCYPINPFYAKRHEENIYFGGSNRSSWSQIRNKYLGGIPQVDRFSDTSLESVLSCITHCIQQHGDCGSDLEQPSPSRVIYVGTEEEPTLYLHEPEDQRLRYVCLSYCWGKQSGTSPMLKTTSESLDDFRIQIDWSRLPKTFQDAILFTRKLKIGYIWIDALCIIQDDAQDCAQEIGQMAEVYRNAFLTIAATDASGPHDGLCRFGYGSPTVHEISREAWNPQISGSGPLCVRLKTSHPWEPISNPRNLPLPLMKRAWAFQERCLSRRLLHFTKHELIWECMTASGCECRQPITIPGVRKNQLTPFLKAESMTPGDLTFRWMDIVSRYADMNLTFDMDTLPALSGLATRWQSLHQDRYLAGLWRDTLTVDLCWYRFRGPKCFTMPRKYQAPSWSWAHDSIGDGIAYININNAVAEIIDVDCTPKNQADPTGQVSSGYLKLAAKAAPASLILPTQRSWCSLRFLDPTMNIESVQLDWFLEHEEETDVYVVAIGTGGNDIFSVLYLMILAPNQENSETYQRRGICSAIISKCNPESEKIFWHGWNEEKLRWWTEKGGDGWMEFTIV